MDNGQNNRDNQNNSNEPNNDEKKNGEIKTSVVVCLILVFVMFILFSYVRDKIDATQNVEISYNEFIKKLEKGELKSVVVKGDRLVLTPKKSKDKDKIKDLPMTYYTGILNFIFILTFLWC